MKFKIGDEVRTVVGLINGFENMENKKGKIINYFKSENVYVVKLECSAREFYCKEDMIELISKNIKNNKSELIVRNYTNKSDLEVMEYVSIVIEKGKKNIIAGEPQYCLVTIFPSGIRVYCNRKGNRHTFYVMDNYQNEN